MVVNGNTTFVNIIGLLPYTEYRVSVVGVSSDGQPHKSYNFTAWTKEGGVVVHLYFLSFNIIIQSVVDQAKGKDGGL